jgi:hypothetical protein
MNWTRAIEINRDALTCIVAELLMLLVRQGGVQRLRRVVYEEIARLLLPAESAVRRLIVMAARGLVVPAARSRPMPEGLVIAAKGGTGAAFQLFDTRKQFGNDEQASAITGPRIRMIDVPSPRDQFLKLFIRPDDGLCSEADTRRVSQRLAVLKRALEQLPREALRMARWLKRRSLMERPVFTRPMRPGRPPGHVVRSRDELHAVLLECHALAWDSLKPDTS